MIRAAAAMVGWLLIAAPAADCRAAEPPATTTTLRLQPVFLRETRNVPADAVPATRLFLFTFSPGRAYGRSGQSHFPLGHTTTDAGNFTVDMEDWTARAAELATPMSRGFRRYGYTVTPSETRLGAVAPETFAPRSRRRIGRWGHWAADPKGKFDYLIVYVDRPCRIMWQAPVPPQEDEASFTFDVEIPQAGFNLIAYVQTDENTWHAELANGRGDLYLVTRFLSTNAR